MKSMSVSMMKGRKSCHQRMVPKEGSQLRALYDLLMGHKGETVDLTELLKDKHDRAQKLGQLRQYYELDIRLVRHHQYCLVGEWVGVAYIDYLAEKANAGND